MDLRLRVTSPELLGLPWRQPLEAWDVTAVDFRDFPVGPSRHLVRFVEADDRVWALKELPVRVARKEYGVLRELEARGLSAVRTAGVVVQPFGDNAILVTHYLERSWQYRRLLMRLPSTMTTHRARLLDAMAALLVDLHRNGFYWGDCSLANTLFMRDGQVIQAWMVDAETAEVHPSLTAGQRQLDLDIMVENVTGGLLDVAARREEPTEVHAQIFDEAQGVAERYEHLWMLLHDEPVIGLGDQQGIADRLGGLNELGFAVDEVHLQSATDRDDLVRLKVNVAGRRFHADQLRALTGLDVLEGQAKILLDDLRSYIRASQPEGSPAWGDADPEPAAARRWVAEVLTPGMAQAYAALQGHSDPIQAYCDLLEVRWLLSEDAGYDVGDRPALDAVANRVTPDESAANLSFVDLATEELPVISADLATDRDPA